MAATTTLAAPAAAIRALNDSSRAALGDRDLVQIRMFPFNLGRESRLGRFDKLKVEFDRRLGHAPPLNDLYLIDSGESGGHHVSREHFRIDWIQGRVVLIDRSSRCGTIVGDRKIGVGQPTNDVVLEDGDTIVVGGPNSPFVFQFQFLSA